MRLATALIALFISGAASADEPVRFERVAVVVGPSQPLAELPRLEQAERDALSDAENIGAVAKDGLEVTADDGTFLVVYGGHGAGGDCGEPALLTSGVAWSDPVGTGLSVDALIGPSAADWPELLEWEPTVTTTAIGAAGRAGGLLPAVQAALGGAAVTAIRMAA
jgi:hypothetical protein